MKSEILKPHPLKGHLRGWVCYTLIVKKIISFMMYIQIFFHLIKSSFLSILFSLFDFVTFTLSCHITCLFLISFLLQSRSVVSEHHAPCHSQCMSPMRLGYRELGLELVSLEDNRSLLPKKPTMKKVKRDDGAWDHINLLLEESLTRQQDEMMEIFSQIL
jgi:hypothetical protein